MLRYVALTCCDRLAGVRSQRCDVAYPLPGALQLDVKTVILTRTFIVVSVSCILRLSYVRAALTWGVSCSQGSCKHLFAGRSSLGQFQSPDAAFRRQGFGKHLYTGRSSLGRSQFPDACFHVPALGVSWLFLLPLLLGIQGKLVLPSWLTTIRQLGSGRGRYRK